MAIVFTIGRVYAAVQIRNCSSRLSSVRRYSSQLCSIRRLQAQSISAMVTTATTFVNPIIANVMPVISKEKGPAFNYRYQTMSRAFSATRLKTKAIDEMKKELSGDVDDFSATCLKTIKAIDEMKKEPSGDVDAFSASHLKTIKAIDKMKKKSHGDVDEKKWPEVFLKALEREGVTNIMLNSDCCINVRYALKTRFKSIQYNDFYDKISVLYQATGFAAADRGNKDRPGVCITSANSGILAYDALVKCRRLGENLPVVCIIGPLDKGHRSCLQFNDEHLMSLKHYYRIVDVRDITTVVQQAFASAYKEGGPVFIDIQHLPVNYDDVYVEDSGFDAEAIVHYLKEEYPMFCAMYVSSSWDVDDVGNANGSELSRFVELTGIPVTRSLVGLADLNRVVLYLGATSNDLPAIVALDPTIVVFPVNVGDNEMTKIIKNPIPIPTLKEINELLVRREGICDWSSWAQIFFEEQRKLENTLTSCYADIFTTTELEANDNKDRITREVAIQVLDEFFEANKEDIVVFRDCESWLFGNGAVCTTDKHVFVVLDGFDQGVRANWPHPCKIILDNTGWTKRFYHETLKVDPDNDWHGEVVMNKSDLKDALYDRLNDKTNSIEGFLVVALAPPPDHREIIPNFSRDIRFVSYPSAYVCNLVHED